MTVTLKETITLSGITTFKSEKLNSDDIRLDILKSRNETNQWGILGYHYTDKCSQTKYGYRVTEYSLFRKDGKETIKREYTFN